MVLAPSSALELPGDDSGRMSIRLVVQGHNSGALNLRALGIRDLLETHL